MANQRLITLGIESSCDETGVGIYSSEDGLISHKLFSQIGDSDITSHINFKLFCKILKKENLSVKKIINQNEFLQRAGIIERANIISKNMTFKGKADMYYRLKKLLNHNEMGNLFKVLFAQKKERDFSLGF